MFAKNAEAALRALGQQPFKVAFLDHDLHWMHAYNTIFKGTGKEVARFLAAGVRGIVIIHCSHEEGAATMKKYLSNVGSRHLKLLTLLRSEAVTRRLLNLEIDRSLCIQVENFPEQSAFR